MKITKNPELRQHIYNNIRQTVAKDRSGIHLSDLIYCSRKAFFRKMGVSPEPSDELCMLWMTGYAFQAFMFPNENEITVLVDGINCTPDIPGGIEIKSTRQSSRNFDLDNITHYKRQILGYCKALNKLEYDLVVMFVCGNYAPPFPSMDCWHITATQEEVDANWNEVLEKSIKLQEALKAQTPPEPDCMDWECSYCENIDYCQDFPLAQRVLSKKKLDKNTRKEV